MLTREQMIERMSAIWDKIAQRDSSVNTSAAFNFWAILPDYKLTQHHNAALDAAEEPQIN